MLEKLTPAQEARLPEIAEEWTAIGLATGDCDVERSKECVARAYEAAGLQAPSLWLVLDSPWSAAIGVAMLKVVLKKLAGAHVRDQVRVQVRAQVGAQVRGQVWDQVGAQVRAQVRDQVGDQVRAQVRDQVWAQVRDQVGDQVWDQVWDQVGDQVWDQVWGAMHAPLMSFFAAMREFGVSMTPRITPLAELCKHCGWWIPYERAAVLQHKPSVIARDADGHLHREDGMAVEYRDGFGVWAINGVRLPQDGETIVLRPHEQTIEQIRAEPNAEVRRIRIERFGWPRYIAETNPAVVDARSNDYGDPCEMLIDDEGEDCRRLICTCPSSRPVRMYAMAVPAEITSCEQAQHYLRAGDQTGFADRPRGVYTNA